MDNSEDDSDEIATIYDTGEEYVYNEDSESLGTLRKELRTTDSDDSGETVCDVFEDIPQNLSPPLSFHSDGNPIVLANSSEGQKDFDRTSTLVDEDLFSKTDYVGYISADSEAGANVTLQTEVEKFPDSGRTPAEEADIGITDTDGIENSDLDNSLQLLHGFTTDDENEREMVGNILVSKCCTKDCLLFLTGHDVLTARKKICALSAIALRQWLVDKIMEGSHYEKDDKLETHFSIAGTEVCQTAFCQVFSLNTKKVYRAIKSVKDDNLIVEHGNKGRKRTSIKTDTARIWMDRYFNLVGDKMPNSNQIHLPSWETRKDVYARYKDDMEQQQMGKGDVISLDKFYKLWNENYSNVIIPEVKMMYYIL